MQKIFDLTVFRFCICCQRWLGFGAEEKLFCSYCWSVIKKPDAPRAQLPDEIAPDIISAFVWDYKNGRFCSRAARQLKGIESVEYYQDIAREICGQIIQKFSREEIAESVVIPVPTANRRGNHGLGLGRAMAKILGVETLDILKKVERKDFPGDQKNLSRKKRLELEITVCPILSARQGLGPIEGARRVFIVDDVITTGATAAAARAAIQRALKESCEVRGDNEACGFPPMTTLAIFHRQRLR